jgi:upstream activation factor subunit UAF30
MLTSELTGDLPEIIGNESGSKPNALQKPLRPSEELAAVVGPSSLSRGEVVSKIWEYIRANNLQNPENRREILADDKLRKVFGKDKVTMFEMNKHLTQHLKSPSPSSASGDNQPIVLAFLSRLECDLRRTGIFETCGQWPPA